MARIRTVTECDVEQLADRLRERDDVVVLERLVDPAAPPGPESVGADGAHRVDRAAGEATFEIAHGPITRYRRTVSWQPAPTPDRVAVDQTIEFTAAIPYWARLYHPLLRRVLPDGVPPGTTPWWCTPDRLSSRQSTVVAVMALFNVTAGLIYGLLTQVLTFVAADLGDGSRSEQTSLLAVARLGVVVTIVAMVLADRRGRRRVAIWYFAAAGVLTVAAAAERRVELDEISVC